MLSFGDSKQRISQGLRNLIKRLLQADPRLRLDFEEFFNHEYLREAAKQNTGSVQSVSPLPSPDPEHESQRSTIQEEVGPALTNHRLPHSELPSPDTRTEPPDPRSGSSSPTTTAAAAAESGASSAESDIPRPEGSVHQLRTPSMQRGDQSKLNNRHDSLLEPTHDDDEDGRRSLGQPFRIVTSPRGQSLTLRSSTKDGTKSEQFVGAEWDLAATLHQLQPGSVLDLSGLGEVRRVIHSLKVVTKRAELVGRCGEHQLRRNYLKLAGYVG